MTGRRRRRSPTGRLFRVAPWNWDWQLEGFGLRPAVAGGIKMQSVVMAAVREQFLHLTSMQATVQHKGVDFEEGGTRAAPQPQPKKDFITGPLLI